ncbi:PREDICTED: uncharacterized protein LOC107071000 [Polistes dominula]|uniref:Uncharacterized protein LOC107071000 n=1 Tax=Polistes dominula TaxID=743375 RepID=A0ABM1IY23_POLDO|nr:PREDICTED: uncharacterized protein LOC107071000 [Polistes dominula]
MAFTSVITEFISSLKNIGSKMYSERICEYQNAYNIQILKYEKLLHKSLEEVEIYNAILKSKSLTIKTREKFEQEMQEIQDILAINKEKLNRLRRKDRRSFVVAIRLIFTCFIIYILYYILTSNFSTTYVNTT